MQRSPFILQRQERLLRLVETHGFPENATPRARLLLQAGYRLTHSKGLHISLSPCDFGTVYDNQNRIHSVLSEEETKRRASRAFVTMYNTARRGAERRRQEELSELVEEAARWRQELAERGSSRSSPTELYHGSPYTC